MPAKGSIILEMILRSIRTDTLMGLAGCHIDLAKCLEAVQNGRANLQKLSSGGTTTIKRWTQPGHSDSPG